MHESDFRILDPVKLSALTLKVAGVADRLRSLAGEGSPGGPPSGLTRTVEQILEAIQGAVITDELVSGNGGHLASDPDREEVLRRWAELGALRDLIFGVAQEFDFAAYAFHHAAQRLLQEYTILQDALCPGLRRHLVT